MTAVARLGWTDAVVVVAGTPWDGVPSSERQLTDHLAPLHPVVWVDPPVSVLRAWRAGQPVRTQLRRVGPDVVRLTPVTVPGSSRPVLRVLVNLQRRRALRRTLRNLDVIAGAVMVATLDDMLDVVPGAVRTFYGTDDYVAGAQLMGLAHGWSQRAERRQITKANVVLAVSDVLCARWSAMGAKPVLVPNGTNIQSAPAGDSGPPASDVALPSPVAGFVGHISDRIDVALLDAVAHEGVSVLLVGPVSGTGPAGLEELLQLPNVVAVGPRQHADLARYYRLMDVGLTPYADTAFNRASFPLKTLEYLAAGLPVVSTDLPAVSYLHSPLVRSASGPAQFAAAVVDAIEVRHDPEQVAARQSLARQHSWARRADQAVTAMNLNHNSRSRKLKVGP
jgi:teichuronic acid biosynthesis glycosyltransferase TuaH